MRRVQQRGAAILLAMLVVTLIATLAAGLQWRQWRMFQQEMASRAQSQAGWVLVGALDWARLILREDARASASAPVDYLGEPWALPLQEAKLSSFLSADHLALVGSDTDDVLLSGQVLDAQAKINLTNLINGKALSEPMLQSLGRLYDQLGLSKAELQLWTRQWVRIQADVAALQSSPNKSALPLRPQRIEQMIWLGVAPASVQKLKDFVTILPMRTSVNLNTASLFVLQAVIPELDITRAQRLVLQRAAAPFQNLTDVQKVIGGNTLDSEALGVSSNFFEVQGRLRLGDWLIEEISLVQRTGQDVKTIWRRRS